MAGLSLFFTRDPSLRLVRSFYWSDYLEVAALFADGEDESPSEYIWAGAAQAFAVLLLRCAAGEKAYLEESEGPVASLASLLSRRNSWVHKLFGAMEGSVSLASLLFSRRSSNLLGRSTVLSLDATLAPAISVYVADREVRDRQELRSLAHELQAKWQRESPLPESPRCEDWLRVAVHEQAIEMLNYGHAFNRSLLVQVLSGIASNPYFQRFVRSPYELLGHCELGLAIAGRLGIIEDETRLRHLLSKDEPIRIAVPAVLVGPLVILKYLQEVKGYNIEINYRFPHSTGLLQKMQEGSDLYDTVVLSVGNTASLIGRGIHLPYRPLMPLPNERYKVVASKSSRGDRDKHKRYLFITELPSAQAFCFEELKNNGAFSRMRMPTCINMEPDEATMELHSGDPSNRALLCFPHYRFNELFNGCVVGKESFDTLNFLCCHNRLLKDRERSVALNLAIRDAWLELRADPKTLQKVVDRFISEPHYRSVVARAGGHYHVEVSSSGLVLPKSLKTSSFTTTDLTAIPQDRRVLGSGRLIRVP